MLVRGDRGARTSRKATALKRRKTGPCAPPGNVDGSRGSDRRSVQFVQTITCAQWVPKDMEREDFRNVEPRRAKQGTTCWRVGLLLTSFPSPGKSVSKAISPRHV